VLLEPGMSCQLCSFTSFYVFVFLENKMMKMMLMMMMMMTMTMMRVYYKQQNVAQGVSDNIRFVWLFTEFTGGQGT